MKSRQDYFNELMSDARGATDDEELQAALVIADGLNGVRKALLDINDQLRKSRNQFPKERVGVEWA